MKLDANAIGASPLVREPWYYSIELASGVMTSGQYGTSAVLPRELLRLCEVEGQNCLDIGPMEGLISSVLCRRGAASVTATDITRDHVAKIDLVKSALGVDLEHIAPVELSELPAMFAARKSSAFDLVVFSGVLYHVLDIIDAMASVRALVRDGGLMIVETWATTTERDECVHFNARGRYTTAPSTYWLLSIGALDYLLRYFALRPIGCAFTRRLGETMRIVVACQAVSAIPSDPGDTWMQAAALESVAPWPRLKTALPSGISTPLKFRGEPLPPTISVCDEIEAGRRLSSGIKAELRLTDSA